MAQHRHDHVHRAIVAGLARTVCQLVSTACHRLTRRSSSNGIATTLEAKMGAASRLPSASQSAKSVLSGASTTCVMKSMGLSMGTGASSVMSADDTSTQPVPASASKAPNCTRHQ